MSGNRQDVLRQFCDVTGADENRSKFFLESSNWQLEEAISSFYEHGGNVEEPLPTAAAPVALPPNLDSDSDSDMESTPEAPQRPSKKEKKKTNTKFATLDSLQQESSSEEEEASHSHWLTLAMLQIVKGFSHCDPCPTTTTIATGTHSPVPNNRDKIISNEPTNELKNPECDDECTNKDETLRLKKEVQRLLGENSALRKEIARYKSGDVGGGSMEEPGQAFYAGGSERSGQQILGPSKGRKDIVTEMFKSVKERGAVVVEDEPATSSRGRGGGAFAGVGYRLGQTADDHEPVTPAGVTQAAAGQGEVRSVRLRLYREGFTVDQGPLRSYTDPQHAEFLNYIRRGEIPPELAHGGEVRVSLEDRRHEEGPRTASRHNAFQGKGHMLGSPTPPTVGAPVCVAAAGAPPDRAPDRAAAQRAAQDMLHLDETQPTTTVQFRLADGSRLTGRFNHTHTVADLHQYISRAEPAYQLQNFVLLTTFPSKELDDPAASLAAANLLNTTLLQRLK